MDCFTCQHFYVTWDADYPRGCRHYNFKTSLIPSHQVKRAIGADCPGYHPKPSPPKRKEDSPQKKKNEGRFW